MKAIKQIIDYLRERGDLTFQDLKELASQGFLQWDDVFSPVLAEPAAAPSPPGSSAIDDEDLIVRPRAAAAKRDRVVVHKGPVLTVEELGGRLAERFEGWNRRLRGLTAIGRRLGPCTSWQEASVAIRNADPEALDRALGAGLEKRSPTLKGLWQAIGQEDYRTILEPGLVGAAAAAYRALLVATEHAQLGKHARLLKNEEVCHVMNLKTAQRLLLESCGRLLDHQPDLLATAIHRDAHPVAYWALVLVYSARRGRPGRRPKPLVTERGPLRELLDQSGWQKAWSNAAVIDRRNVPPFLAEWEPWLSCRMGATVIDIPPEHQKGVVLCPKSWDWKGWDMPQNPG